MITATLQTVVFVLSPDHTHVLLMHRDKWVEDIHYGKYFSLGGHVEPDEDVLTCARREVFEESGLTVTDLALRGTVIWTGFGPRRQDLLCFMVRADTFTGTPHGGNDKGHPGVGTARCAVHPADVGQVPSLAADGPRRRPAPVLRGHPARRRLHARLLDPAPSRARKPQS